MRVLIYGGRDFVRSEHSDAFLDSVRTALGTRGIIVVCGAARGADTYGELWAMDNGYLVDLFPADWAAHGRAAGHIRNQQMLDSGIDLAIEFPGGKGTADMRKRLDKAGITVVEYTPDG
jgi:hypothetical protein